MNGDDFNRIAEEQDRAIDAYFEQRRLKKAKKAKRKAKKEAKRLIGLQQQLKPFKDFKKELL